ncbi:50S ribosomal protein L31 [Francisella sciaenopsi]
MSDYKYKETIKMRQEIHPKYTEVTVTCSCGNTFVTKSTIGKNDLNIDICSECHPFYTGKQRIVDTAGRVDKFKKRFGGIKKV